MSDVDVSELMKAELPAVKFPAEPCADFRLHFAPEVHRGIFKHAHDDPAVEICGVLVGSWAQDSHGPYAVVEDFVRCESATSKFAEVTFTHESWAQINREMDTRFEDKRIVGWYHSHPDFGIFLSDRDCFIHEHFFSGPGQVAYVVDPVRDLEGAFAWKHGKPMPLAHYWVGNSIRTVHASVRNPAREDQSHVRGQTEADSAAAPRHSADDPYGMSLAMILIGSLALFLLGYFSSGWRSSWERQAIVDGVVSNYTDFKLLKLGLRQELDEVQKFLGRMDDELRKMPAPNEKLSTEQAEDLVKTRKLLENNLAGIQQRLSAISERYDFSEVEMRALQRHMIEMKRQRLQLQQQAANAAEKKAEPAKGNEVTAKSDPAPLDSDDAGAKPTGSPSGESVKE